MGVARGRHGAGADWPRARRRRERPRPDSFGTHTRRALTSPASRSKPADAALEVRRVSAQLGGGTVLADVSLTAHAGEIVALLGPSGCGKTTLLRVIAGLQPHSGDVLWQGRSLAAVPAHRRGFGLVFQDQALFPHLDVERNVAFGLRMQPRTRPGNAAERGRRVAELLDLVGLGGFGRRPVDSLSGGEAQRVALARALAPHPRLLMLDEPLSGLDRPLREQLLVDLPRILRRLRQTALFVTHDLEEALAVSDQVAVMRAGRIVQVGPPGALYDRPATVFVARFLGRANILHGTVRTADAVRTRPQAAAGTPDGADSPVSAGNHRLLLETDIGLLPYDRSAVPGARGTVLIRPEMIELVAGDTAARAGERSGSGAGIRHSLRGTLRDTSFRGIAALATVLVGATTLQVLITAGRTLPAMDSTVTISFDPPGAVLPLMEDEP